MIRCLFTLSVITLLNTISAAAVVYTKPVPSKTITQNIGTSTASNSYLYIDVDKDYVDDYLFRINFTSGSNYAAYMWSETQIGLAQTQVSASASAGYIGAVSSGTSLSLSSSWMNAVNSSALGNVSQPNLINQGDVIIGLRFLRLGAFHYGWMRLNVSLQTGSNITIKVIDYAYETIPYDPIVAGSTGALPLTLHSFTASKNNELTAFRWKISNAENVLQFGLEQSVDGQVYTTLATVPFTTAMEYQYKVYSSKATLFYRLKIIDKDGNYQFSQVIKVTGANDGKLTIFPNPSKDMINVQVNSEKITPYELVITSAEGSVMHKRTGMLGTGMNTIQLNTDKLSAGYYVIQLINSKSKQVIGFVKQ